NEAGIAFKKALIEASLNAELSHHLGYAPGSDKPAPLTNHRNGSTSKTVLTGGGKVLIETPRDREGSFEPLLIPKHARRFTAFDDSIVALCERQRGYCRVCSVTGDRRVAWIVRLVKTEADGEERCADVMKIDRPDDLADIADLGLTLAEGKLLLAGLQQEIVAAQARSHAVRRPDCRICAGVCHVKDYRDHAVATLFGQVTVRLPRFR